MQVFRTLNAAQGAGPVALTIGNFDGVHRGHQAMLARLTERAGALGLPACVMTFEPHPREFFTPAEAPARLTSLREKLGLFAAMGVARTYVCRFDRRLSTLPAQTFIAENLQRLLRARWVLIGDDFRFGAKRRGDFAMLQRCAVDGTFEVESMQSVEVDGARVSSTAVRATLQEGRLVAASHLLGRDYAISGRVVHGEKTGRQLGFPTANIQLKHNKPPLAGIFAVKLLGLEKPFDGVASLGTRPTIRPEGRATLEVHLFDFDRVIYGEHVSVAFLHKLRDEERYPDLATLTAQIERDVDNARAWLSQNEYDVRICPNDPFK